MRSRSRRRAVWALCALAALSACQTLPPDPGAFTSAYLLGVVYDGSSQGVQGMQIMLDGVQKTAVRTDINGRFTLGDVAKGPHTIDATKPGYDPVHLEFEFLNRSQIVYIVTRSAGDFLADAQRAVSTGNYQDASEALAAALRIEPGHVPARFLRAILLQRTNQLRESWIEAQGLYDGGRRDLALFLLMIDLAGELPENAVVVRGYLADNPYAASSPQIVKALSRISGAREDGTDE